MVDANKTGEINMINRNEPANPVTHMPEYQHQHAGLTKREHFAAMAMQGLLSNEKWLQNNIDNHVDVYTRIKNSAYQMADFMLDD